MFLLVTSIDLKLTFIIIIHYECATGNTTLYSIKVNEIEINLVVLHN